MTEPTLQQKIDTLRDLLAEATPGPWAITPSYDGAWDHVGPLRGWRSGHDYGPPHVIRGRSQDAHLIAAARNYLPDILQLVDDLVTLIDVCDAGGIETGADWTDPRWAVRAIYDAHDLAHTRTGGDSHRKPWADLRAFCTEESINADVRQRVLALLDRTEGK